jgi:hypothetical protein
MTADDGEAIAEMVVERKAVESQTARPIVLIDTGIIGTAENVSFRFKGSAHIHWTNRFWIQD